MSRTSEPPLAMLDWWTPDESFGEPLGCLATTYTFHPDLFAEHCLARFLRISAPPSDIAYRHELIQTLQNGPVYAGVLVDHSQAGQDRPFPLWDVLPVRLPNDGIQHAKVTLLRWSHALRIIVSSSNLSEQGYRINREVSTVLDGSPNGIHHRFAKDVLHFLGDILAWVPDQDSDAIRRARTFLNETEQTISRWTKLTSPLKGVTNLFVPTLPPSPRHPQGRSTLDQTLKTLALHPDPPSEIRVASPFLEKNPDRLKNLLHHLAERMHPGPTPTIRLDLVASEQSQGHTRTVQAPPILKDLALERRCRLYALPGAADEDPRPWHAKCLLVRTRSLVALLAGSSNFTCAGMGFDGSYNIEANVLTLLHTPTAQERAQRFWPPSKTIDLSTPIDWKPHGGEQEPPTPSPCLPHGFLSVTYSRPASGPPTLTFRFNPEELPPTWSIHPPDDYNTTILTSEEWTAQQRPAVTVHPHPHKDPPPSTLLVRWNTRSARWPVNIHDPLEFPALDLPTDLDHDEWLALSVSRNKSAFLERHRRRRHASTGQDDSIPLDPLQRYPLSETFLHKVRRRARALERWKESLERPLFRLPADSLRGRLEGSYGAHAFLQRLRDNLNDSRNTESPDERLLRIAEAFIVLQSVRYRYEPGALPPEDFHKAFRQFLRKEAGTTLKAINNAPHPLSQDILTFCQEVLARCQKA